jgi:hypothetical protein
MFAYLKEFSKIDIASRNSNALHSNSLASSYQTILTPYNTRKRAQE